MTLRSDVVVARLPGYPEHLEALHTNGGHFIEKCWSVTLVSGQVAMPYVVRSAWHMAGRPYFCRTLRQAKQEQDGPGTKEVTVACQIKIVFCVSCFPLSLKSAYVACDIGCGGEEGAGAEGGVGP